MHFATGIYYKINVHIKLNAYQKVMLLAFYIFPFLSCLFCLR